MLIAGCESAPVGAPPAGPGAASSADFSPWVAEAQTVHVQGELSYFGCFAEEGHHFTWSINPVGPLRPCEVDVRACEVDAKRLENRKVIVIGKLIERQPRHLNLIVATHIVEVLRPAEWVEARGEGELGS